MQGMDTETIGEENRDIYDKITLADYRYEEIYPSFKAGTDEKEITADLNRRFIRSLMQRRPVGNLPLKVADIGRDYRLASRTCYSANYGHKTERRRIGSEKGRQGEPWMATREHSPGARAVLYLEA